MRRGSRGPASPPENSCFEILCFHVCWGCCFSCAVRSRYTICYLLKAVNSTVLMSGFVCHSSSLNKKNHYCWTTRKTCARFSFVSFSPFSLLFLVFVFLTFHVLEQQVFSGVDDFVNDVVPALNNEVDGHLQRQERSVSMVIEKVVVPALLWTLSWPGKRSGPCWWWWLYV